MVSEIISLISVTLALTAVCVSIWQARANRLNAAHSRSLPVLTESISQFRSQEFRESVLRLIETPREAVQGSGFESLPQIEEEMPTTFVTTLTILACW
jgi:hypothetical protein